MFSRKRVQCGRAARAPSHLVAFNLFDRLIERIERAESSNINKSPALEKITL
jgi:hypothetical protein